MKLPDFILAGSPKCGSTSLYYYLAEHPDIFMPKQKEIHYFTSDKLKSLDQGPKDKTVNSFHIDKLKDYNSQFVKAKDGQIIGEVSPSYINYPDISIPRIKKNLGNPKIIFLIRDPIKRAYSNYLHLIREDREHLSFYEAIQNEQKRIDKRYSDFWYYTFNSFYFNKIKAFDDSFDDILIITTEELKSNTIKTMLKVYEFLGLKEFQPKNFEINYNAGGIYESNLITKFFFRQSKLRSFIKRIIPITQNMKHLKQRLISNYKKETPNIDKKTEALLANIFREDVIKLKKEFDVDIEYWNPKLKEKS